MVGAVMAEFEFVGFAAEREAEHLMAEANTKNRPCANQFADGLMRIRHGRGISRAVGKKNPVGTVAKNIGGSAGRRDNSHPESGAHEAAQDVALDPIIDRDDQRRVTARSRTFEAAAEFPLSKIPLIRLGA